MRNNFKLLQKNIDTEVILAELSKYLEKNSWSDQRSKNVTYHSQTKHISLRDHALNENNNTIDYYRNSANIITNQHTAPYFTGTFILLKTLEKKLGGQLERVMIIKLEGKSEVKPHIDEGTYYIYRDRYHLVLKTNESINFCGDETQIYNVGELWWFDNKKLHSVENRSKEERIHLIFDIIKKKKDWKRKVVDKVESVVFRMIARLQ